MLPVEKLSILALKIDSRCSNSLCCRSASLEALQAQGWFVHQHKGGTISIYYGVNIWKIPPLFPDRPKDQKTPFKKYPRLNPQISGICLSNFHTHHREKRRKGKAWRFLQLTYSGMRSKYYERRDCNSQWATLKMHYFITYPLFSLYATIQPYKTGREYYFFVSVYWTLAPDFTSNLVP